MRQLLSGVYGVIAVFARKKDSIFEGKPWVDSLSFFPRNRIFEGYSR
jgi:hypothetical protein